MNCSSWQGRGPSNSAPEAEAEYQENSAALRTSNWHSTSRDSQQSTEQKKARNRLYQRKSRQKRKSSQAPNIEPDPQSPDASTLNAHRDAYGSIDTQLQHTSMVPGQIQDFVGKQAFGFTMPPSEQYPLDNPISFPNETHHPSIEYHTPEHPLATVSGGSSTRGGSSAYGFPSTLHPNQAHLMMGPDPLQTEDHTKHKAGCIYGEGFNNPSCWNTLADTEHLLLWEDILPQTSRSADLPHHPTEMMETSGPRNRVESAQEPGHHNETAQVANSILPQTQAGLEYVIQIAQANGFHTFDELAIAYYTADSSEKTTLTHAQYASRCFGLGPLLRAIYENSDGWSEMERQGFMAEIRRAAENNQTSGS